MDARQLEYFLAIVEHGGFSKAAAALHVAQPSLSQAMANLEADLGVALFHRVGRGVVLSEAAARNCWSPAGASCATWPPYATPPPRSPDCTAAPSKWPPCPHRASSR